MESSHGESTIPLFVGKIYEAVEFKINERFVSSCIPSKIPNLQKILRVDVDKTGRYKLNCSFEDIINRTQEVEELMKPVLLMEKSRCQHEENLSKDNHSVDHKGKLQGEANSRQPGKLNEIEPNQPAKISHNESSKKVDESCSTKSSPNNENDRKESNQPSQSLENESPEKADGRNSPKLSQRNDSDHSKVNKSDQPAQGNNQRKRGTERKLIADLTNVSDTKQMPENDSSPVDAVELTMEMHIWSYILFKRGNVIAELTSKHSCCITTVKMSGGTENTIILKISSSQKTNREQAAEDISKLCREFVEKGIVEQTLNIAPYIYETFNKEKLTDHMAEIGVLIQPITTYNLIGPVKQVERANGEANQLLYQWQTQANTTSSPMVVHETPCPSIPRSDPVANATPVNEKDCSQHRFCFETESGLTVHMCQGNLIRQSTEAIVNPANGQLAHGSGAARAIAVAAGRQLEDDCKQYIKRKGEIRVSNVMHTTAGNLFPAIRYVMHAVGPDSHVYGKDQCEALLKRTFYNCLIYANFTLAIKSISIPAISSGVYGVHKEVVASCAYEALMDFDTARRSATSRPRNLQHIYFINNDTETADVMARLFKFLRETSSAGIANNSETVSNNDKGFFVAAASSIVSCLKKPTVDKTEQITVGQRSPSINDDISRNHQMESSVDPDFSQQGKVDKMRNKYDQLSANSANNNIAVAHTSRNETGRGNDVSHDFNSQHSHKAHDKGQDAAAAAGFDVLNISDFSPLEGVPASQHEKSSDGRNNQGESVKSDKNTEDDLCVICQDKIMSPKQLECGHTFCTDCIDASFAHYQPKCPSCGKMFGILKGNQPPGTFNYFEVNTRLAGYEQFGAIEILYHFPNGTQNKDHPNPGKPYYGTTRRAYLPASPEGREVCNLLRRAFDAGVVFTIGCSNTTGQEDVVIWNDVHHKTGLVGQYGYPDPTYLTRVKKELADKGIVSDNVTGSPGNVGLHSPPGGGKGRGKRHHYPSKS